MTPVTLTAPFKSPLYEMTQTTPTCLWNDSASTRELTYSIENGAVGATCNPVIVLSVLREEMGRWAPVLGQMIEDNPTATDDQIGWMLVEEISKNAPPCCARSSMPRRAATAGCPSRPIPACSATPTPWSPRPSASAGWPPT